MLVKQSKKAWGGSGGGGGWRIGKRKKGSDERRRGKEARGKRKKVKGERERTSLISFTDGAWRGVACVRGALLAEMPISD